MNVNQCRLFENGSCESKTELVVVSSGYFTPALSS